MRGLIVNIFLELKIRGRALERLNFGLHLLNILDFLLLYVMIELLAGQVLCRFQKVIQCHTFLGEAGK